MIRPTHGLALAPVLFVLGCGAILKPNDEVERCDNSTECDDPEDARFIPNCIRDGNQGVRGAKGVCVTQFATLSCDPAGLAGTPYATLMDEAASMTARYASDCTANAGKQGCPPMAGGACDAGLTVPAGSTVCDDQDGTTFPAFRPPSTGVERERILGQDVADQFCRSLYCDATFVCKRFDGNIVLAPECHPCVEGAPIGHGGCGDLYINGARSSIYTPDVDVAEGGPGCAIGVPADAAFGAL